MWEEERPKERTETKQPTEESIRRNIEAEEAGVEQRNGKVRDFLSDKTFVLWENNLKDRGFIVERRFNKLISPFIEMIEKR